MSKSLADLRAAKAPSRPERSVTLCLAPHLVAEVQALTDELAHLAPEKQEGPRRAGQGEHPRAREIRDRLDALLDEMEEFTGEVRVRASLTDGEWRRWCDDHPAREEGEPGHDRDQRVSYGFCNADDLLDNLDTFAAAWNGEPLAPGDWLEHFEPRVASADKAEMARAVVAMYESRVDFQQWRNGLRSNLKRLNGSASPGISESPTSDSTDGNPEPSSTASTETGTESP